MSNNSTPNANAIQGLIGAVAGVVSNLSPLAKAVVAAVLPLITALVNMAIAGSFNTTSIVLAATGVVTSLGVYLVPNKTAAAVPPAPAAAAATPAAK